MCVCVCVCVCVYVCMYVNVCIYVYLYVCTGVAMEGLYRVSGITSEVLRIKKEFDRGQ